MSGKKSFGMLLDTSEDDDDEEEEARHPPPLQQASPGRILYTPNGDQILELSIETLMGTTFEVRLPAKTLVSSIKNRLQRSEGVPRHHLHIIHAGQELPDDLSLKKCGVRHGDRLKLVLAMRGGPINTRRVALPVSSSSNAAKLDLQNLMLKNKDQIMEKMPRNGQVTVLLFREGDKVNVYHVLEKPDGSFSPLSNLSPLNSPNSPPDDPSDWPESGHSLKRLLHQAESDSDLESNPVLKQRLRENASTMNKMSELRTQMENLSMLKKSKKRKHHKVARPKSGRARLSSASTNYSNGKVPLPPINSSLLSIDDLVDNHGIEEEEDFCTIEPINGKPPSGASAPRIPKVPSSSRNKVPDWLNKNYLPHGKTVPLKQLKKQQPVDTSPNGSKSSSANIDLVDLQFCPKNASLEIVSHRKTQKLISTEVMEESPSNIQPKLKNPNLLKQRSKTRLNLSSSDSSPRTKAAELRKRWIKKKKSESHVNNKDSESESILPQSDSATSLAYTSVMSESNSSVQLVKTSSPLLPFRSGSRGGSSRKSSSGKNRPKFVANTLQQQSNNAKKNKPNRCAKCNKKINITNTFGCRCDLNFCPKHRHPELHECSYDYKTEGRKQLEAANPLVVLPKLPKI